MSVLGYILMAMGAWAWIQLVISKNPLWLLSGVFALVMALHFFGA